MNIRKTLGRAGVIGMAAVVAAIGLTGPANAASANISSWTSGGTCGLSSPYYFCLYYSPNGTGGRWASTSSAVSNLSGRVFSGGAGDGQAVRNNAASAQNATNCNVGIWEFTGYSGDSNWLSPNRGGNLTSYLRNNEASIAVADSTRCPGIGIG